MSETQIYKTVTFATQGEVVVASLALQAYIKHLDAVAGNGGYSDWPKGAEMRADAEAAQRAIEA